MPHTINNNRNTNNYTALPRCKLTTLLFIMIILVQIAAADDDSYNTDQPQVRCTSNTVCPNTFPICCSGFCVSAGSFCCSGSNGQKMSCDPGEQCCSSNYNGAQCCGVGYSCTVGGCAADAPCSFYTDPGLCLEHAVATNITTTTPPSSCAWSCTERRCMSRQDANNRPYISTLTFITSVTQICPDTCNSAFTCNQCLNGTHGNNVPCFWCASDQTCTFDTKSCLNNMKVLSEDVCSNVLYRGAGIVAAGDDEDGPLGWLQGGNVLALGMFVVGLVLVLVLLFLVVKLLIRQTMTANEMALQRDQQEEHIVRAVPRFGFEEDSDKKDSDDNEEKDKDDTARSPKRSEKSTLLKKNTTPSTLSERSMEHLNPTATSIINGDREGPTASTTTPVQPPKATSKCSVCKTETGGESRRNFIVASEKEQERAAYWSYVVVLPCNHKICKQCLLSAQSNKTGGVGGVTQSVVRIFGRSMNRIRGASTSNNNSTPNGTDPAATPVVPVAPLSDVEVSSAAVMEVLGEKKVCMCCTTEVQCVFIPSKMLK